MTVKVDEIAIPADALREVEEHDEQIVIERNGQPVALVVSSRFMKVFRELAEELENRLDLEAYFETKQEIASRGEEFISLEQFRKEQGI